MSEERKPLATFGKSQVVEVFDEEIDPLHETIISDSVINQIVKEARRKNLQAKEEDLKTLGIVCFVVFLCFASVLPYSGENDPPKFGDYEAQRHWMEIAVNLPVTEWYENSTRNNLMYWGLDYPPLTAYHSWAIGKIAEVYNKSWVELETSRGHESPDHKFFMRCSVIFSMIILYLPTILEVYNGIGKSHANRIPMLYAALFFPGLIYIDSAHFQYNHICLGLALKSFLLMAKGNQILGSFLFVLALNFKQMALYYALPVFFFLLGRSLKKGFVGSIFNVAKLGITVLLIFLLLWSPFLADGRYLQVLHRVFPVARGLFEDKVASFWCVANVVVKFNKFPIGTMTIISTAATLLLSFPALLMLIGRPTERMFKLALVYVSLTFFLFSAQVHEKTILFVAMPIILHVHQYPVVVTDFLSTAAYSLFPLVFQENAIQSFPLFVIYHTFCLKQFPSTKLHITAMRVLNLIIFLTLAVGLVFISPPARYPYLWQLFFAFWSFLNYFYTWIFFFIQIIILYFEPTQKKKEE
ncbi:unnamed protein product [Bursaphelenchus xylophilus]|uniref:Alpha-1,3-glucosyltransferase n=1 Tax=Bursaphelenchus xylophilus TaxID=6326 RepID=A0A1I7SDX0_BURXY|nr:unnamed protein product [Bursaphelenchus xylophilus]CAG9100340.1 unnamed protein product [Bursaphelenchus xylophilus]